MPSSTFPAVLARSPWTIRQKMMAYFLGTMTDPGQVWVRDMETGATRQLTHLNQGLLKQLDLGKVEEVWFKARDGHDLQGWILTPPGFDPKKKYPSILEIHGGPQDQYGNLFMHEFYFLAAGRLCGLLQQSARRDRVRRGAREGHLGPVGHASISMT